jgi:polyhydroxyalkanoate synthesis repressor PhaR
MSIPKQKIVAAQHQGRGDGAKPGPVIIKKYGKNRRLYDTSASRYVNLEEIAAWVQEGKEVQVVDAKTGEDLTRVTLTQIIVEKAKDQPTGLPLELLRQLIMASDHVGREFIMWYLKSAFDAYHSLQDALKSGLSKVHSAGLAPLQITKNLLQGAAPEEVAENNQLQELRKRLAELETRLEKPNRKQKRLKPTR